VRLDDYVAKTMAASLDSYNPNGVDRIPVLATEDLKMKKFTPADAGQMNFY
jgi:hypothetical protein